MFELKVKSSLDKLFSKLSKKDPALLKEILKKTDEICSNKNKYKFLRKPMQGFNRVHIKNHFVLVFQINQKEKTVTLYKFGHHDEIYKWKPE